MKKRIDDLINKKVRYTMEIVSSKVQSTTTGTTCGGRVLIVELVER